ncbi:hypothetical protein ACFQV8_34465 [Pseudonocardia benzenivorans]
MAGPYADEDFPADPYPGTVPPTSYVHADGVGYALVRGRVQDEPLDGWLAARGAAPTTGRLPVLAYGSNRNPSKISWLRATLGLGAEPVVVLRVRTRGLAAVWAYGLRTRDGARPAVLAAVPGVEEDHVVWLATPEQVAVLDACEGAGPGGDGRYRLARLHTGEIRTRDVGSGPTRVDGVLAYLGEPRRGARCSSTAPWCGAPTSPRRRPGHSPASPRSATAWSRRRCRRGRPDAARYAVADCYPVAATELDTAPGSGLRELSFTMTTAASETIAATAR